jgi:hypothetical protein
MKTMNDDDICRMCGRTRGWHEETFVRHPFTPQNAVGELRDTTQRQGRVQDVSDANKGIVHTTRPFDPALRLALIEAGILTIQQLSDAEKKLQVVSDAVNRTMNEGNDTNG